MGFAELLTPLCMAAVGFWLAFKVVKWVVIVLWVMLQINWYMFTHHPIWSIICFGFWIAPEQPIMSYLAGQTTLIIAFGYKWDKPGMLKAMGIGTIAGLWLAKRKHDKLRIKD